jgi:hypothetical protein
LTNLSSCITIRNTDLVDNACKYNLSWEDSITDVVSEFTLTLIATLFGVLFGIPAGLYLESKLHKKQELEEKLSLLGYFEENLKKNIQLMEQAVKEVPKGVIFYNMDLSSWPNIQYRLGILQNPDLEREILRVYYEFGHLSRKLERLFELAYSPLMQQEPYQSLLWEFRDHAIVAHLEVLVPDAKALLESVKKEVQSLTAKSG